MGKKYSCWSEFCMDILDDFFNVRSVITLGAFITAYRIGLHGNEVPQWILHIIDILLGFWFGQKIAQNVNKKEEQK